MNKLMISLGGLAATAVGFVADPMPALAQSTGNQAEVVVYGNDPCPRSTDDQIVVCRRRPETERYRLPKNQQLQGTRQQRESWSQKSQALTTVGKTGAGSCSAVGPGGFTGCVTQQIQQAKRESQEQTEQNTAPPQ
jgi:hypothetical protein